MNKHSVLLLLFLVLATTPLSSTPSGASPAVPEDETWPEMVVQLGHTGSSVLTAAYSPDNRFIITGGVDAKAKLWDAKTGAEIRRFEGHTGPVHAAFSPDGKFVFTGGGETLGTEDHTARLWEVATGREVRRFEGHKDGIRSVAFSHDGRYVLTGGGNVISKGTDFTVRLWDVNTGNEVRRFVGHTGVVRAVAFSPDDEFVLTGSDDRTAVLWERSSAKLIRRYEGHEGFVNAAAFSADGRYVLTGSGARSDNTDNSARLWERDTGREIRQFRGHTNDIFSVAFSPDGRFVLTGSADKTAILWETDTAKRVATYTGHTDFVRSVAFSSDGLTVLTSGDDATARTWDTLKAQETKSLKGYSKIVTCAKFSPDGRFIATGDWGGTAHLWELSSGREIQRYKGDEKEIRAVTFSPDGKLLLTGSGDQTARVWDALTGELRWQLPPHEGTVYHAAFSPDGSLLLTIDSVYMPTRQEEHGIMRLWDVRRQKELTRFGEFIDCFVFSSDGRRVLTGGDDGYIRIYRTEGGAEITRWKAHEADINTVAFSSDDKLILSGSGDFHEREYTARLWNAATGSQLKVFEGHTRDVNSVAFSPDNKLVLTSSSDKTAILWDAQTGAEVRRFSGHIDEVNAAVFSPDGTLVLTAAADQTTRLWKTASGRELCRLITFDDGTWVVANREGRFDTNNLEQIEGLHWVMQDDPLTALPVEIFMRPYFEPRLLPRLVAVEDFKETPSFASLNRVQPKVVIVGAALDGTDTASVTVEVERTRRRFERRGGEVIESGAQGLRLFRDRQLVDYRDGELFDDTGGRSAVCKPVPSEPDKCRVVFEKVKLPRQAGVKEVEFSAYAFNTSDVKSETHRLPFTFSLNVPPSKGRVYLISVGVNSYQNPSWDLEFAANDARRLHETAGARLRATGAYDEVVELLLTSEEQVIGERTQPVRAATKDNLRKLIRLLAGEQPDEGFFRMIPGARRIRKATPDDVVIIFYSSHGYRDEEQFYLFPYDTGEGVGRSITDDLLQHCVSSNDLSLWLRDVDAGDIVLIVDACHAAAAVDGGDFKPGPMGSRGMGQLAYDKGMRVLAATQPDTTAAEVNFDNKQMKIKQGLLTYVLVDIGLVERRADVNGDAIILVQEWLEYVIADVPRLYEEIRKQLARPPSPGAMTVIKSTGSQTVRLLSKGEGDLTLQQPVLFDFAGKLRRKRSLILAKGN